MYDPIPWHLDAYEAARRGFAGAGWYVIGDDGTPAAGPHEDPEACIVKIGDRISAESRAQARCSA